MNAPVRYVLMVVIDPNSGFAVGLTKKKGPAKLLNKVTFPGGKLEAGENVRTAASREMLEETAVEVPESAWTVYESIIEPEYELHKLVALSDKVLHARQCEQEPVWHLAYERHLEYARIQPNEYAPDFISTLEDALKAVAVPRQANPAALETCGTPA